MFTCCFRKLVAGPRREHLPDKLLYRDEAWFESVDRERKEGEEKGKQKSLSETMTAPPEEQGDSGPLVPCKVGYQPKCLFVSTSINLNFFLRFAAGVLQQTV